MAEIMLLTMKYCVPEVTSFPMLINVDLHKSNYFPQNLSFLQCFFGIALCILEIAMENNAFLCYIGGNFHCR